MTSRAVSLPALLALLLACAVGASGCKESSSGAGPEPSDKKEVPELHLDGVDTSALTPRERREFSEMVTELLAPCTDTPVSVATCITEKRPCATCKAAAKYIMLGVRNGRAREEVEHGYKARFDANTVQKFELDGWPTRGPKDAPVTLVEFADFECPACAAMAPVIERVMEERKDKVRLVYVPVALNVHQHAEAAARAGLAAGMQGKFWEMHHLLFANQQRLERADLEHYARALGLDMAKFVSDESSDAVKSMMDRDRKLMDTIQLSHTPTVFLNGREVDPVDDLQEWLNADLGTLPDAGAAASAGSPSSTPPPSPSSSSSSASAPVASASATRAR